MKIISCRPSFSFISSKKKPRSAANSSSSRSTRREENSSSSSFDAVDCPKVSRRELETVLRRLQPQPPTEEEVSDMLAEADVRGDGQLSVGEIAALGLDVDGDGGGLSSPDLRETFGVFDNDGDGKISAEELCGVFATLGDEVCTLDNCRRMIGVVDTDGDGFVCFDEFARMMRGQR